MAGVLIARDFIVFCSPLQDKITALNKELILQRKTRAPEGALRS
jgi:hypothetical protein